MLFAVLVALQAALQPPPVRVAIVPTSSNELGKFIATAPKSPDLFYVVLTNVSKEPQPVFEAWNSWGYRSIAFELQLPDGSTRLLRKKAQRFTVNFPSTFEIPPGECMVYPIRLDDEWENLPAFAAKDVCAGSAQGGEAAIRIRAIYEVEGSAEAVKQHVWLGRTSSAAYQFTLRWWPSKNASPCKR